MVLRTIVVFCGNIYNYARDSKKKRGLVNFLLAFYKSILFTTRILSINSSFLVKSARIFFAEKPGN